MSSLAQQLAFTDSDFPVTSVTTRNFRAPLDILLVEDNPSDAILARKSVESTQIAHQMHILQKGSQVLPYLWRSRHVSRDLGVSKMPDVIMLDLMLPDMDGFDVLSELRLAPTSIRGVPIIILSGYDGYNRTCQDYDLYLMAYAPKPCPAELMQKMLSAVRYNGCFL